MEPAIEKIAALTLRVGRQGEAGAADLYFWRSADATTHENVLIPSFQFIDLCLGPKNRPVVGGDISACFSNCWVGFSGPPLPLMACYCLVY